MHRKSGHPHHPDSWKFIGGIVQGHEMSPAQIKLFERNHIPYGAVYETPSHHIMKLPINEGMNVKATDITRRFKKKK